MSQPAATTPKGSAVAGAKPAPVSSGLAARMAAFNQPAAPSGAGSGTGAAPATTPKGSGSVAAKFQASVAANNAAPAAGASSSSASSTVKPVASGSLAGKMNALNLNPGLARAGSTKKSMADIMFEKFDADGSGTIDDGEMHLLCNKMGYLITAGETALVVKALDLDGSGKIDKNEFKAWWNKEDRWAAIKLDEKELAVRQNAAEAFVSYDTEGKGVLNKKDFEAFYKSLVEKKLTSKPKEAVFADLDKNNDGTISFAEYSEWLVAIGTVKVKVLTQEMVDGAKNVQLRGAKGLHPAIQK